MRYIELLLVKGILNVVTITTMAFGPAHKNWVLMRHGTICAKASFNSLHACKFSCFCCHFLTNHKWIKKGSYMFFFNFNSCWVPRKLFEQEATRLNECSNICRGTWQVFMQLKIMYDSYCSILPNFQPANASKIVKWPFSSTVSFYIY